MECKNCVGVLCVALSLWWGIGKVYGVHRGAVVGPRWYTCGAVVEVLQLSQPFRLSSVSICLRQIPAPSLVSPVTLRLLYPIHKPYTSR
jgi:hypothetical protein